MKKLLLIPLLALFACSPRYSETTYVSDFTQHVKDGFQIFPVGTDLKTKNYTPLASLSTVYQIGIPPQKETKRKDELYQDNTTHFLIPSGKYMTDKLVNEAKSYGANAVINFKIEPVYSKGNLIRYIASGIAVNIE